MYLLELSFNDLLVLEIALHNSINTCKKILADKEYKAYINSSIYAGTTDHTTKEETLQNKTDLDNSINTHSTLLQDTYKLIQLVDNIKLNK